MTCNATRHAIFLLCALAAADADFSVNQWDEDGLAVREKRFAMDSAQMIQMPSESILTLDGGAATNIPLVPAKMYRTTNYRGPLDEDFTHHANGTLDVHHASGAIGAVAIKRDAWKTHAGITESIWNGAWIVQYDFNIRNPVDGMNLISFYLNSNIDNFGDKKATGETGANFLTFYWGVRPNQPLVKASDKIEIVSVGNNCNPTLKFSETYQVMCSSDEAARNFADKGKEGGIFSLVVKRLGNGKLNFKMLSGAQGEAEGTFVHWELQTASAVQISTASNVMPNNVYFQYINVIFNRVRGNPGGALESPTTTTTAPAPTPKTPAGPQPAGSAASSAAAVGDPHLTNIHGQKFDLMHPGMHTLLQIPRHADSKLLYVRALAQRIGAQCADMYFLEVNITGAWAEVRRAGGFQFSAEDTGSEETSRWITFGTIDLKVAPGRTQLGIRYLNFYVQHLSRAGFVIGGLLGEDDHTMEETKPKSCGRVASLSQTSDDSGHFDRRPRSFAEASLA